MFYNIARAVVTYLAVLPSLTSALPSESVWGREISESPKKLGALLEDPDFLMATIADSTYERSPFEALTADRYQTLLDKGQTGINSLPPHQKAIKSLQDVLEMYLDVSLNPDLKKISQVFALNQLAMPFQSVDFSFEYRSIKDERVEAYALLAPLKDERYPDTKNTVHVSDTGRLYPTVKGYFIHESTHIAMQRIYENDGDPYASNDEPMKRKYENAFDLVTKNLEEIAHEQASFNEVEAWFYERWYQIFDVYPASSYHRELIVMLPEMLARFDVEAKDLPQRLQTAIKPYLACWDGINQDISSYVSRMKNVLDITDIQGTFSEEMLLNADLAQKENLYVLIQQGIYTREDFKGFMSDELDVLNQKGTIQALLEHRMKLEDVKHFGSDERMILKREETQQALLEGQFNIGDLKNLKQLSFSERGATIQALLEGRLDVKDLKACNSDCSDASRAMKNDLQDLTETPDTSKGHSPKK